MSSRKSIRGSGESQYEVDPDWNDNDSNYSSQDMGSDEEQDSLQRRPSVYSQEEDSATYLHAADRAMGTLQGLHDDTSGWKRALKHKSGVVVYATKDKKYAGQGKKGKGSGFYAPVFKGELIIKGYSPAAVFGVVGTRKLWDDWYKEGSLIENLSDTSSLTYMCMKGITGSSTRDLSLVEQVSGSATGTIMFASTSVVTPKVPRVAGRVRASIALNGWVMEPVPEGTKTTYYLHVNVNTFVPAFAATKYLARRPVCIAKIDDYLQAHGPPPMAGVDTSQDSYEGGGAAVPTRRRRDSTSSKRSARSAKSAVSSAGAGAFPTHVEPDSDASSYGELQKAQKMVKSALAANTNDWSLAMDNKESKIWMRKADSDALPTVKGEALVEGVTTEQVLGTIMSGAARRDWDTRYQGTKLVTLDNGFDQGVHIESHKGIYPVLTPRSYIIARGVDREDAASDNGTILLVSRSTKSDGAKTPKGTSKGQVEFEGWLIEDHSDKSVKVTHVAQYDIKEEVKPVIFKILVSELARAPRAVAEFVDDYGYAPFFVRWSDGPATLEANEDGDLKEGRAVFRIGGEGKGTMKDGQQKCWLQYSEKMYERGVNVVVKPDNCVTISKVEGVERTVEFAWSDGIKDGATVTLTRADGDGAEDFYVKGEFLDRTVGMAAGGAAPKKKAKREVSPEEGAGVVAGGAGRSRRKSVSNGSTSEKGQPNGTSSPKQTNGHSEFAPVAMAAAGAGAVAAGARSVAAPVKNAVAPVSVDQKQMESNGGFPADACLIISKDLYFTRSQCAFMGGVVAVAFLWGKFA